MTYIHMVPINTHKSSEKYGSGNTG